MLSAHLQCFINLWILLKFLFSFSWKRLPQKPSTTKCDPDGDPLPQPAPPGHPSPIQEASGYELDSAQNSFEKAQWDSGTYQKDSFVGGKPTRDNTIPNDDRAGRNETFFATASAMIDHLDMLDLYDDEDTSQDLCVHMNIRESETLTDDVSALGRPSSYSTDMSDLVGDDVLNESLVLDILSGLTSEADLSTSYDADTSDDFLGCTTLDWADIDSIVGSDSSWKHEVATAMHAFRSCKVDNDDILALLPDGKQRLLLRTRRISQGKQLQEIQEWRNDFGSECDGGSEPDMHLDGDYSVITTFRFP